MGLDNVVNDDRINRIMNETNKEKVKLMLEAIYEEGFEDGDDANDW